MSYKASDVMDMAAAILNDTKMGLFTYATQLPHLRTACRDLGQDLALNEIQVVLVDEKVIPVNSGDIELALPPGFFVPTRLYERRAGESAWVPITEKKVVEPVETPINTIRQWDFRHNCINFNAPTENREVRLEYLRTLPAVNSPDQSMLVTGAINTLGFKTAEYCAKYIGGNPERAVAINVDYQISLDKLVSIYVKNNQGKRVRRKPFRLMRNNRVSS